MDEFEKKLLDILTDKDYTRNGQIKAIRSLVADGLERRAKSYSFMKEYCGDVKDALLEIAKEYRGG